MAGAGMRAFLVVIAGLAVGCGSLLVIGDDGSEPATEAGAEGSAEAGEGGVGADGASAADGSPDAGSTDAAVAPKRVFITAKSTRGALGGPDGGDAFCNEEAKGNGLPPTFVAYLSVNYKHPRDRVADAGTWAMVDGTLVFDKPPGVGAPLVPLTQTAAGASVDAGEVAWTGFHPTSPNNRCQEWTTAANNVSAYAGTVGAVDGAWQGGSYLTCDTLGRLYCFEQ